MPTHKILPLNNLLSAFNASPSETKEAANYRLIAEQFLDAIFLVEPKAGKFYYANDKACALIERHPSELHELFLSEIITDQPEVLELIRQSEPGIYRALPSTLIRKRNGTLVQVSLRLSAVAVESKILTIIMARDITEQSLPTHPLSQKYQALDSLAGLLNLLTEPTDDPDQMLRLCHQFLNATSLSLYRRHAPPVGLKHIRSINFLASFPEQIPPNDPLCQGKTIAWHLGERPLNTLAIAARGAKCAVLYAAPIWYGQQLNGALVVTYQTATEQPANAAGLVNLLANYCGALLHQQAQALSTHDTLEYARKTEALHEALMQNAREGILRIDATGQVNDFSPATEELLGFNARDLIHAELSDVLVAQHPLAQELLETLQQKRLYPSAHTELIRRDGDHIAVAIHAAPLLHPDGSLFGGLIFINDQRKEKHFEERNIELEKRAWLGQLSRSFAHEIRTPLGLITLSADLLAKRLAQTDPKLTSEVNIILENAERINHLYNTLSLVTKQPEIKLEPLHPVPLLEHQRRRWQNALTQKKIQLNFLCDPHTPLIMGSYKHLEQVFTNLIDNALDAMKTPRENHTLTIQCHAATAAPLPGNFVEIITSDTGAGIPSEVQNKIFDAFVTYKEAGTGLGLAITRQIITDHKGVITVESFPDIGTAFHIFLPVAENP